VGPGDLWRNIGTGDAERLAALLSQCALVIGVDSGPLHVAGATDTPTLAVWLAHSPVQFYDLCPNVMHLVPEAWCTVPPCQNSAAARFFAEHYTFQTYHDLQSTLIGATLERLEQNGGRLGASSQLQSQAAAIPEPVPIQRLPRSGPNTMPSTPNHSANGFSYGLDYYTRNKDRGLDLLNYGLWQERYGWWIVEALGLDGRRVLDVGCACGSMLRGLLHAGADMEGVDCSEFLVERGRQQWPELRDRLHVGDAVNLQFAADATYDWLHSCVVAEHWKPELVPYILAELLRVVKPGGSFYCAYESGEVAMPDGRSAADEPTHLCLKPPAWWEDRLRKAGWQITSSDWARPLHEHPQSFMSQYGWAWFVARRPTS
jgi:SAM-dependent methyltransferase